MEMKISLKEQIGYNHRLPLTLGGGPVHSAYDTFYTYIDKEDWAHKVRERRREGRGLDKIYLSSFGWCLLRKALLLKKGGNKKKEIKEKLQEIVKKEFPEFFEKKNPAEARGKSDSKNESDIRTKTLLEGIKKLQEGLEILGRSLEERW